MSRGAISVRGFYIALAIALLLMVGSSYAAPALCRNLVIYNTSVTGSGDWIPVRASLTGLTCSNCTKEIVIKSQSCNSGGSIVPRYVYAESGSSPTKVVDIDILVNYTGTNTTYALYYNDTAINDTYYNLINSTETSNEIVVYLNNTPVTNMSKVALGGGDCDTSDADLACNAIHTLKFPDGKLIIDYIGSGGVNGRGLGQFMDYANAYIIPGENNTIQGVKCQYGDALCAYNVYAGPGATAFITSYSWQWRNYYRGDQSLLIWLNSSQVVGTQYTAGFGTGSVEYPTTPYRPVPFSSTQMTSGNWFYASGTDTATTGAIGGISIDPPLQVSDSFYGVYNGSYVMGVFNRTGVVYVYDLAVEPGTFSTYTSDFYDGNVVTTGTKNQAMWYYYKEGGSTGDAVTMDNLLKYVSISEGNEQSTSGAILTVSIANPVDGLSFYNNTNFTLTGSISCTGGTCGGIQAWAKFNSTFMNSTTPLITANPYSCGALYANDTCNATWQVNAVMTGVYSVYIYANSTSISNESSRNNISIVPFNVTAFQCRNIVFYNTSTTGSGNWIPVNVTLNNITCYNCTQDISVKNQPCWSGGSNVPRYVSSVTGGNPQKQVIMDVLVNYTGTNTTYSVYYNDISYNGTYYDLVNMTETVNDAIFRIGGNVIGNMSKVALGGGNCSTSNADIACNSIHTMYFPDGTKIVSYVSPGGVNGRGISQFMDYNGAYIIPGQNETLHGYNCQYGDAACMYNVYAGPGINGYIDRYSWQWKVYYRGDQSLLFHLTSTQYVYTGYTSGTGTNAKEYPTTPFKPGVYSSTQGDSWFYASNTDTATTGIIGTNNINPPVEIIDSFYGVYNSSFLNAVFNRTGSVYVYNFPGDDSAIFSTYTSDFYRNTYNTVGLKTQDLWYYFEKGGNVSYAISMDNMLRYINFDVGPEENLGNTTLAVSIDKPSNSSTHISTLNFTMNGTVTCGPYPCTNAKAWALYNGTYMGPATDFIATNPYDCGDIAANSTCYPTWQVTPMQVGNYSVYIYANATDLFNESGRNNITVFETPAILNLTSSPASPIAYGIQSNITCWVTIGDNPVSLFRNGTEVNSTENGIYFSLPAGTWNYSCVANATSNYSANVLSTLYTVNRGQSNVSFSIAPVSPITYETQSIASCTGDSPEASTLLYRNMSSVPFNETEYLPASVWNYTCNVSQTQNYTSASTSQLYTVNKRNANVLAFPTNQTQTYEDSPLTRYCTDLSGFHDCNLYQNDILITNNTNPRLGAGGYVYIANISDTSNYTNYQSYQILNISQKNANVQVFPITQTIDYGNTVLQYCTDASVLLNCSSTRNAVSITNNTNYGPAAGTYTYVATIGDGSNYTNYQDTETLTVDKLQLYVNLYLNGTKNSNRNYTYPSIGVNATGEISSNLNGLDPSLFRDGVFKGTDEYVDLIVTGNYTYKVNATGNENYTANSTGVSYLAIVTMPPTMTITSPTNSTYLLAIADNKTIAIAYSTSYTYPLQCKYRIDSGSNVTLPGCGLSTFQIPTIGSHTFTLFVKENFTYLENYSSVVFTSDFQNRWNITDVSGNPFNGTASFSNSTYSYELPFTGGVLLQNTSNLPIGNMSLTISAPNFNNQTKSYLANSTTQISDSFTMLVSGIQLRVFYEDSGAPISWWRLYMTNSSLNGTGEYTTQLTVGKGWPGQPFIELLDGNQNTYISNVNANYSYNFGYLLGTFNLIYSITGASNTNNNITIEAWNQTQGNWVNVLNLTGLGNATKTTANFTVDNSLGIYGDLYTALSLCNQYYCPLFQIKLQNSTAATQVSAYDVSLISPFTYDENGFASVNYTDFQLVTGISRFKFDSPLSGGQSNFRTYFVGPSTTASLTLDAYLNPNCFMQRFMAKNAAPQISGNPIPIPNATLSVTRQLGASSVIIDQQRTNALGEAQLCVEPGYPYTFYGVASGYYPNTVFDWVFANTGSLVYVDFTSTGTLTSFVNPFQVYANITPNLFYLNETTNVTCQVLAPLGTALESWFTVYVTYHNTSYPPFIPNMTNITLTDLTYPPLYNNSTLPFNLTPQPASLLYDSSSLNPYGMVFTVELPGSYRAMYSMSCGIRARYNSTSQPFTISDSRNVWMNPAIKGIAPAGKQLTKYMSETSLYIVALILDMMISGWFVVKFGAKSGFIFLLVWGMILTILGGWGLTIQTGIFVAGVLLWGFLLVFPYRRSE